MNDAMVELMIIEAGYDSRNMIKTYLGKSSQIIHDNLFDASSQEYMILFDTPTNALMKTKYGISTLKNSQDELHCPSHLHSQLQ